MKIDFIKEEGKLTVLLDGRLDTTTAPQLESFIAENLSNQTELVIDCEKLNYVSSAGLRVLLSTHKKTNGALKLIKVCEIVMEVFDITGFTDVLTIE